LRERSANARDWPTERTGHAEMREQQQQAQAQPRTAAETWMQPFLAETGVRWTRQAQWGYRLFDFWSHRLGIAIKVEEVPVDEAARKADDRTFQRSMIHVFRVRAFDDASAAAAVDLIQRASSWNARRAFYGKKPIVGAD
jgi:hypothetical protein